MYPQRKEQRKDYRPLVMLLEVSLLIVSMAVSLAGRELLGTLRMNSDIIDIKDCLYFLRPI